MSSNLSKIEYEDQFYGFNQPDVVSFVIDTIIDNLECALQSLGRKWSPKFGEEATTDFIATALGAYRTAIKNRHKEIEKIVSFYFAISSTIVHPDDQIHDELPDDEEARLDRQLDVEQRKFQALYVMERNMKNFVNDLMKDTEDLMKFLEVQQATEELRKKSQLLISSLDSLPLHQFFSNMNLNQN